MIVVFVVVLVVFGPQKLPELARGLGKIMAEFRKASTDFKSAFEEEMREMERQALQAERKKAAEAAAAAVTAEPSQPAILDSPAGAESTARDAAETNATDGPVISPVAESVPRSPEDAADTNAETAAATNSQDPPHDTQPPA
jgi:sec-independent protein translocase protein TatB